MPLIGSDRPRDHHYVFAHRALRALASQHAQALDDGAATGALVPGLASVWATVGEDLPADERLPADGLGARRHLVGDRSVLVVTLPPAEHVTEAYFVGLVMRDGVLERYIVLEHSWTLDDAPSTWLGEWTPEAHLSLGPGPPADEAAFVQVVQRLLDTR